MSMTIGHTMTQILKVVTANTADSHGFGGMKNTSLTLSFISTKTLDQLLGLSQYGRGFAVDTFMNHKLNLLKRVSNCLVDKLA